MSTRMIGENFVKAVTMVTKGNKRTKWGGLAGCVSLATDGKEQMRIESIDKNGFRMAVDIMAVGDPLKTVVDPAILLSLISDSVKRQPEEVLELSLSSETNTLRLDHAGTKATMKTDTTYVDFPDGVFSLGDDPIFLEVAAEHFDVLAKFVATAAAKTVERPTLTAIEMKIHASDTDIAATDGFRLHLYRLPLKGEFSPLVGKRILLPALAVKKFHAMMPVSRFGYETYIMIDLRHNLAKLASNDGEFSLVCPLIDGKFPDYSAIIPQCNVPSYVGPITEQLKQIAKIDRGNGNQQLVRMSFIRDRFLGPDTFALNPFDEASITFNLNEQFRFADSVEDQKQIKFAINPQFVIDAIGISGGDWSLWHLPQSKYEPLLIVGIDNGTRAVIMPINFNKPGVSS